MWRLAVSAWSRCGPHHSVVRNSRGWRMMAVGGAVAGAALGGPSAPAPRSAVTHPLRAWRAS